MNFHMRLRCNTVAEDKSDEWSYFFTVDPEDGTDDAEWFNNGPARIEMIAPADRFKINTTYSVSFTEETNAAPVNL